MAITLGKLTILVGAGIIGSVLAKEGRVSDIVSGAFSGAFKIAWRQIKQDDQKGSSSSVKKPNNELLIAQVNSLRQELQNLASSNRSSVTIVTSSQSGTNKFGIIVITVVVGYGYVWWKGWKLPNMMFATRRSLSDACNSIAKQLENVYSSIAATKRKLSSQVDDIDRSLDECLETTTTTHEEVLELDGKIGSVGKKVKSVRQAVQTLETKISRIEGKQNEVGQGVWRLCDYAWNLENKMITQRVQIQALASSSSRQAVELPPSSPLRSESLPVVLSEPESPYYSTISRLDSNGLSDVIGATSGGGETNGTSGSEESSSTTPSSGPFGWRVPSFNGSFFSRTRSATNGMLEKSRSTAGQRL